MSEYTGKRWEIIAESAVHEIENNQRVLTISNGGYGGVLIAQVYSSNTHETDLVLHGEAIANANLLADAPALLAVLNAIIDDLPTNRDWLDPNFESEARELIAKHHKSEL